jgi:hypothetical protein
MIKSIKDVYARQVLLVMVSSALEIDWNLLKILK